MTEIYQITGDEDLEQLSSFEKRHKKVLYTDERQFRELMDEYVINDFMNDMERPEVVEEMIMFTECDIFLEYILF